MLANGRATALLAESLLLPVLAQGRATALLGLLAVSFPLPVFAALIHGLYTQISALIDLCCSAEAESLSLIEVMLWLIQATHKVRARYS